MFILVKKRLIYVCESLLWCVNMQRPDRSHIKQYLMSQSMPILTALALTCLNFRRFYGILWEFVHAAVFTAVCALFRMEKIVVRLIVQQLEHKRVFFLKTKKLMFAEINGVFNQGCLLIVSYQTQICCLAWNRSDNRIFFCVVTYIWVKWRMKWENVGRDLISHIENWLDCWKIKQYTTFWEHFGNTVNI